MIQSDEEILNNGIRKNIIFLSSSFVNIAKMFAENNKDYDVFLIIDRKFPIEFEDLDNFYTFTFNKSKLFDKDKERYFDNLALYILEYEPDFIITNNYTKLLTKSFIDFMKFQSPKLKIINIHHADLRILDENNDLRFKGMSADIKQMLDEGMLISTIHLIENQEMDTGKQLAYSHETTLKELKQKGLFNKKEDILNLRLRNVAISYHERTKVLKLLRKVLDGLKV